MIAALFGESAFHNSRVIEDDGLNNDYAYVEFGDDAPKEIEDDELNKRMEEASQNRLSSAGIKRLKESIEKTRQNFK